MADNDDMRDKNSAELYCNNATEALRAGDVSLALARAQVSIACSLQRIANAQAAVTASMTANQTLIDGARELQEFALKALHDEAGETSA